MSLKDNFNQAVKEILRKDGLVGEDVSRETKRKTDLEKYMDEAGGEQYVQEPMMSEPENLSDLAGAEDARTAEEVAAARAARAEAAAARAEAEAAGSASPYVQNAQASQFGTRPSYPDPFGDGGAAGYPGSASSYQGSGASAAGYQGGGAGYPGSGAGAAGYPGSAGGYQGGAAGGYQGGYMGGGVPPMPPMPPMGGGDGDIPYYETEETTIISRNTQINGNIRSFANLNIDGSVKGDIKITKNINVTGKVVGDIECSNSVMTGASMQGNIASKGQVQLDRDTILLGDISAQYLDLNGKIKGNVDIGGKAEFKTDAIVMGNITASTITVLDGATIQGYVNTTFLQETTSTIFPDAIAVSE